MALRMSDDGGNGGGAEADSKKELSAAVLTPAQRRFLVRESGAADYPEGEEPSRAAKRAMRARIRERLNAAVLDLDHILHHASLNDITDALGGTDDSNKAITDQLGRARTGAIGLLDLADLEAENAADVRGNKEGMFFESAVAAGISRALNRAGVSLQNISVDIEIERGEDLDELAEGDFSELSPNDIRQLYYANKISFDTFVEAYEAARENGGE